MESPNTTSSVQDPTHTSPPSAAKSGVNIAFVGCTHGALDTIYATIAAIEARQQITIDLLLCCGDFEAVRNTYDLSCLAGPSKYHHFKDFYKYYNGEKIAPKLTIFVGGNHEASNHLRELYYGGWAAPNIYFLGYSGVVNFGGLRIGGFSGIWKAYDFHKGHYELPPYDQGAIRSAFHVREYELWKLAMIEEPLDVIMSHDWPDGIVHYGDKESLIRQKPHFRGEIEKGELGCPAYIELLRKLKPTYWLSGHMHCRFEAEVSHNDNSNAASQSKRTRTEEGTEKRNTKFIALDKVLPRRSFLEVIKFPEKNSPKILTYDLEWLSILRATHSYFSFSPRAITLPQKLRKNRTLFQKETQYLLDKFEKEGKDGKHLRVPNNFAMTVEPHRSSPGVMATPAHQQSPVPSSASGFAVSHQTEEFLALVGLPNLLTEQGTLRPTATTSSYGASTSRSISTPYTSNYRGGSGSGGYGSGRGRRASEREASGSARRNGRNKRIVPNANSNQK